MSRFQPDTIWEMALRPVGMAVPDANVYVEIIAPDLRFVFVIVCGLGLIVMRAWRRKSGQTGKEFVSTRSKAAITLSALLWAMFTVWVATTGNGRYFAPGLVVVGPLCAALVSMLPISRVTRLAALAFMCVAQAYVIQQSDPWRAWALATWSDPPYFHIDIPADLKDQPWTFMTASAISYSLLAPQFNPASRWINLHNAPHPDGEGANAKRTAQFLAATESGRIQLLVPAIPGAQNSQGLPTESARDALQNRIARFSVQLAPKQSCRLLRSRTLAQIGLGARTTNELAVTGFWVCPLVKLPPRQAEGSAVGILRHNAVFRAIESQCPRFFPSGGDDGSIRLRAGEMRNYMLGEMKAYVYDNGEIYYKYYRALNAVRIGTIAQLLSGETTVDCKNIMGRSGLPWSRGI